MLLSLAFHCFPLLSIAFHCFLQELQLNERRQSGTNDRAFYTVGVLVERSFLARLIEMAAKPYSQDCRVVVYEFREGIVEHILEQPPNVLLIETESTAFDAAQVAEKISSDIRGHNIDFVLLIHIRVQHTHNLTKYIAHYGKKVVHSLMLPFPPIELERILVPLMDKEAARVKTRIAQILQAEASRQGGVEKI